MVVKAVIKHQTFSSRLHIVESTDLRSAPRELEPQGASITGIRVAGWFSRKFGKSTAVQIGNISYHLNTKSLRKYLVRTAGLSNTCSSAVHKAAMTAFNFRSATIAGTTITAPDLLRDGTVPPSTQIIPIDAPSQRGALLLQHAQMLHLRDECDLTIPTITSIAVQNRQVTDATVWDDLFHKEMEAYDHVRTSYRLTVKRDRELLRNKRFMTYKERFEHALEQFRRLSSHFALQYTTEYHAKIVQFVLSLSEDQIQAYTRQLIASTQVLEKTRPYVALMREDARLTKEKELLDRQIVTFDRRALSKQLDDAVFQMIHNIVYSSRKTETPPGAVTLIPIRDVEAMERVNPTLGASLRAYNYSVQDFKKVYAEDEALVASYEEQLVRLGGNHKGSYAYYSQKRAEFKEYLEGGRDSQVTRQGLGFDAFIAQYEPMGIYKLRSEINALERSIEHQETYIKEPQADYNIAEVTYIISEQEARIRSLNKKYNEREKLQILRAIDEQIDKFKIQYIELQVQHEASLDDPNLRRVLANLRMQEAQLGNRRKLFSKLFHDPRFNKADEIAKLRREIVGLNGQIKHHKGQRKIEIKERKAQKATLEKVVKQLKVMLSRKEKEFARHEKQFAIEEGTTFSGNTGSQVMTYTRMKRDQQRIAITDLTREKVQLEQKLRDARTNFRHTSAELLSAVDAHRPELLTPQHKRELMLEHGRVIEDLSGTKRRINEFSLDADLNDFLEKTFGQPVSAGDACAIAEYAQIANTNFLRTADLGDSKGQLFLLRQRVKKETEAAVESFRRVQIQPRLDSPLAAKFVFEGAQKSIALKIHGNRPSGEQADIIKKSYDDYMRDHMVRTRSTSLKSEDSFDSGYAGSLGGANSYDDLSIIGSSPQSAASSTVRAFDLDEELHRIEEIHRINPLFARLWEGAGTSSTRGVTDAQKLIGELDGFDLTYFSHEDEMKRLNRKEHNPLLSPHVASLLELFVGGEELTGVKLDYKKMQQFVQDRGSHIAKVIKDESSHPYPRDEKTIIAIGYILKQGVRPGQHAAFERALNELDPGSAEIFRKYKIIS